MTSFERGDVVLVKFVFADEKGAKQRPGVIISTDRYHQGRQEAILAAITSNVHRLLVGDHKLETWRESGLLYPSVVTGIIRTIERDMIARTMGKLPSAELHVMEDKLRDMLGLDAATATKAESGASADPATAADVAPTNDSDRQG